MSSRQSPRTLWTAGLALIAIVLVIAKLNGSASPVVPKMVIGLAAVFLVVRFLNRRSAAKGPRAAQPDPQSQLKLD